MSYSFRDLETIDSKNRKASILMAMISSFEDVHYPSDTEKKRFHELFVPLFDIVDESVQRRAISALSNNAHLAADTAQFIALQQINLSAPFLSHSPALKSGILCYIITQATLEHCRIIAKRTDLTKRVIGSLLALNDDAIKRNLQLRGYIFDASLFVGQYVSKQQLEAILPSSEVSTDNMAETPSENALKMQQDGFNSVEFHEEKLRQTLRDLASENNHDELHQDHADIETGFALAQPLAQHALILPIFKSGEDYRSHIALMNSYISSGKKHYFTTALADALGASFAMARRIMADPSGHQLATALVAMHVPEHISVDAIEQFFEEKHSNASPRTALRDLQHGACLLRVLSWLKADENDIYVSVAHVS